MGTIKLKPCPLCGADAKGYLQAKKLKVFFIVQCEDCTASISVPVLPVKVYSDESWSADLEALTRSALNAADKWNLRSAVDDLVRKRLDDYADRIERQINETECKRDVFNLCENAEEKARVTGFVDGLNWLLEIIDDEYTRHDEDDD